VWDAIGGLSEPQRVAFDLRYGRDLAIADVAEIMGRSQGAVKLLLHRQGQPAGSPPPLDLATQPGLAGLAQHATPPPDLRRYDALLQRPASQAVPAVTS